MRVFKLSRYSETLQIVISVVKTSVSQLVVSVVLCFFVVLFSAIVMYTVENPVQPEQFPNVITSLWWAICTLTTVGYASIADSFEVNLERKRDADKKPASGFTANIAE